MGASLSVGAQMPTKRFRFSNLTSSFLSRLDQKHILLGARLHPMPRDSDLSLVWNEGASRCRESTASRVVEQ